MTDLEQTLREIFGDSIDRLSKFQADQRRRVVDKMREMAREAVKDELTRLNNEIADLRQRIAALEAERFNSTEEIH